MQSTKPPYTSIRSVPAGTILGNSDGATAAAQALDASTVRTVIGLGTAATAAAGDFEPAGSIAALSSVYQPLDSDLTAIAALTTTTFGRALLALADAAAGRTALGLGTAATAAIAATGTADRLQKRSGTGNTLVDSLFGVTDTTGIASLMGTTACYRAYDSAGTKYVEAKHDGTNARIQTSSGYLLLASPNGNGVRVVDGTSLVEIQSTQAAVRLLPNANSIYFGNGLIYGGSNYRLGSASNYGLCSDANGAAATDIAFGRAGVNIGEITNGTAGNRAALYTGTHRVYDQALNTAYLTLSHDGTNGIISTSSGTLSVGTNSRNTVISGLWTVFTSNGAFQTAGQYPITWSGQSVGIYPVSSGVLETNNGTAGALATHTAILRPAPYTFATVPTASSHTGSTIRITDRSNRQAYSDGTNWRWTADDVIIS